MIVTTHHRLTVENARELAALVKANVEDLVMLAEDSKEYGYIVRVLETEKM